MAAELAVWLVIGSLCLKAGGADGRFVNRSFLIGPDGAVRARYDKIHMFDVALKGGEALPRERGLPAGGAGGAGGGGGAEARDDASATTCGFRASTAIWRRRGRRC